MQNLTIASCLQRAPQLASVSDTSRLDIEIFLTHILHQNRTYLFTWPEKFLTEEQAGIFELFFARRLTGEPVAHIVGQREFWSLPLFVDSTTLIPRPDTELLVQAALDIFANDAVDQSRRLLDLGTGTGAIVLALAHKKKSWQCVGVDREPGAVALAEKNRTHLDLTNVSILRSDWFSAVEKDTAFDIIVSNPPYIDPMDKHLGEGDVRFEPLSALIADHDGMADLEFVIGNAPVHLRDGGWLVVEHGYDQGEKVRNLFLAQSFSAVTTIRDLGGNERVTLGQMLQNSRQP